MARCTASAVTKGLPSRSPPIHEPGSSIGSSSRSASGQRAQRAAELGVERGDDVEERQLVVAQRFVDLVLQAQPGQSQQRRLPEREHRAPSSPDHGLVDLAGRGPIALPDQLGDLPLDLEDRLAPDLGGMRGHDRADQRAGQLPGDDVRVEVGVLEQPERGREAALLRRRALAAVVPAAALVVQVLGEVGQQGEVAERADDVVGRPDVEVREPLGELGTVHLGAPDPECLDAGGLDDLEDVVPGLLADHLPEDAAEQPDVVAQRRLVGTAVGGSPPSAGRRSATSTVASDTGAVSGVRVTPV